MNQVTTINASSIASQVHGGGHHSIDTSMMGDDMVSEPSSPESTFDESDLLAGTVGDDVATQLAAAGPIGVAAAAAIATGKKRKRPHMFETNPSIRKRQQTRLLRKLKATIDEYTTRVGQQAIVLSCTPGKPAQSSQSFKVFGSQPLESVVRNNKSMIMQDLEACLAQQTPNMNPENAHLHELPPLVIDGIPTPVDKMTQAQLRAFIPDMLKYATGRGKPNWGKEEFRPVWWPADVPWANVRSDARLEEGKHQAQLRAFIPEMLKYSTGRSKPGWGKMETRPLWWPSDLPWANVRCDVRSEEEKKRVSWTHALRTIVKNCYKHHGREDLLPIFQENGQPQQQQPFPQTTVMQTINNPDGTVSIIQIDTGNNGPNVVTLPDGSQATVVHTIHHPTTQEATQAVQTLAEVAANQQEAHGAVAVEMNSEAAARAVATLAEATLNDGQIILTGENIGGGDGTQSMMIPVSMYQTVVTQITQMNNESGDVQVAMAPVSEAQQTNDSVPDATHAVEIITDSS